MSETKTPMTDALLLEINEGRTYEAAGPMADFSRRLEIMCAELAEALDYALTMGPNGDYAKVHADKAKYAKMKGELKV